MKRCAAHRRELKRLSLLLLALAALGANAETRTNACDHAPHLDHPHVTLRNGDVDALIFLPDAQTGYYRSSRFDWSGVVGCASYKGHTYWGEWFSTYDPNVNDSITGPVEEFRSAEGAEGYDAAAPGGQFVKIGVGVLRRDSAEPYKFGHQYPLVDGGHWTVHVKPRAVIFQQEVHSPGGVAYIYRKVLELDPHGPRINIHHELRNLGGRPIVTDVYDHDFFMLDNRPTGPGMQVTFPFAPRPDEPLEPAASIDGNRVIYRDELQQHQTVSAYLNGYSTAIGDDNIRVEDTNHHIGIEQIADRPITRLYLWSIRTTICPEAYIHLDVAPGRATHWTLHYRLMAEAAAR